MLRHNVHFTDPLQVQAQLVSEGGTWPEITSLFAPLPLPLLPPPHPFFEATLKYYTRVD